MIKQLLYQQLKRSGLYWFEVERPAEGQSEGEEDHLGLTQKGITLVPFQSQTQMVFTPLFVFLGTLTETTV